MSDLSKEKSTLTAELIGMNQGRYASKLLKPEEFTCSEITRLSILWEVEAGLIMNVIKNQLLNDEIQRMSEYFEKKDKKKKNKQEPGS